MGIAHPNFSYLDIDVIVGVAGIQIVIDHKFKDSFPYFTDSYGFTLLNILNALPRNATGNRDSASAV